MSSADGPEPGPLTAPALFRLVADEVFRDGKLDEDEKQILQVLARFLKLDSGTAKDLARESKSAYKAGALGTATPLDPVGLYRRVLAAVLADGQIDPAEEKMLEGLRRILGVDDATHQRLLAEDKAGPAPAAPAPSAASPRTSAWLKRSGELAEAGQASSARVEAVALLAEVRSALPLAGEAGTQAVAVAANLAPLLAGRGGLEELEAFLVAGIGTGAGEAWSARPGIFGMVLENALQSRLPGRYAHAYEVVDLAERLALRPPVSEPRVVGWVGALRLLGKAALARSDWDGHGRLLAALARIPPAARRAAAPGQAGVLADGVILGLDRDSPVSAARAFGLFASLEDLLDEPGVRQEYGHAAGCLIEWFARVAERPGPLPSGADLGLLQRGFDAMGRLIVAHAADPELAKAFALMAPFGIASLLAMREEERAVWFLGLLRRVAEAHARNAAMQFELAKAVVNGGIIAKGRTREPPAPPDAPDPVMDALAKALRTLLGHAPGSADLADARGRFERATGRSLAGGAPGPARVAGPRPPRPPPPASPAAAAPPQAPPRVQVPPRPEARRGRVPLAVGLGFALGLALWLWRCSPGPGDAAVGAPNLGKDDLTRMAASPFLSLPRGVQVDVMVARILAMDLEGATPDKLFALVKEVKAAGGAPALQAIWLGLLRGKDPRMLTKTWDTRTLIGPEGTTTARVNERTDDTWFKEQLLYLIRDNTEPDSPVLDELSAAFDEDAHPMTRVRITRAIGKIGGARARRALERIAASTAAGDAYAASEAGKWLQGAGQAGQPGQQLPHVFPGKPPE